MVMVFHTESLVNTQPYQFLASTLDDYCAHTNLKFEPESQVDTRIWPPAMKAVQWARNRPNNSRITRLTGFDLDLDVTASLTRAKHHD